MPQLVTENSTRTKLLLNLPSPAVLACRLTLAAQIPPNDATTLRVLVPWYYCSLEVVPKGDLVRVLSPCANIATYVTSFPNI